MDEEEFIDMEEEIEPETREIHPVYQRLLDFP